jgi:hypothetical protein
MTLWGDKGGSSRFYRKPTNLCEIQLNGAKSRAIQTGYHATRAYVNLPPCHHSPICFWPLKFRSGFPYDRAYMSLLAKNIP